MSAFSLLIEFLLIEVAALMVASKCSPILACVFFGLFAEISWLLPSYFHMQAQQSVGVLVYLWLGLHLSLYLFQPFISLASLPVLQQLEILV